MTDVDVLVPTKDRPIELATTLAGLAAQTGVSYRLVISDQSDDAPSWDTSPAWTVIRWLRRRGVPVDLHRHLPRRGMAEQRAFLLSCAVAPAVLYLDDDVWLEPGALARLHRALGELRCGMVGAAMQALGHADDRRPGEVTSFEPWSGPVEPETLVKDGPGWERWRLHNAANGLHLAESLGLDGPGSPVPSPERYVPYKVAWVAGCVLFDRAALVEAGGFEFWRDVPTDAHGEDVYSQQRVMAHRGAAGILPGGAYHQESPTALPDRGISAVDALRA
ncbi:glycosyltransferase family 2 protein [Actinomycetospora straminea]|uniref:Glycosyltransferase family A protein n=1 Tax=Actinomycetospora straminea TaxID=663607 RepID=A0ABP9F9R8_9PSEU|nr:glycosyltransferase family 2 protein [Actinomycetospora straminea]MDD7936123.1 glycosyltransferase [Actinomycetospora straminea]